MVARRAPRTIGTKIAIAVAGAGVVAGAVVGVKVMTSKNTNAVEPIVSASGSVGATLSPSPTAGSSASAGGGSPSPPPVVAQAATIGQHKSLTGFSFSLRGFSCDGVHGDWTLIETLTGTLHGKATFVWSFANGKTTSSVTVEGSFTAEGSPAAPEEHIELHGNNETLSGPGAQVKRTLDLAAKLVGTGAKPKIKTSTFPIFGSVTVPVKLGSAPECA
jgi:hypothetical protein